MICTENGVISVEYFKHCVYLPTIATVSLLNSVASHLQIAIEMEKNKIWNQLKHLSSYFLTVTRHLFYCNSSLFEFANICTRILLECYSV